MTTETIAIIGGGQAGAACAMELRKQKFDGRLVIIADELSVPYKRPALSKGFLAGDAKLESLYVMPPAKLEQLNIECKLGVSVESINRAAKTLSLSNAETLEYSKVVIATGSRARDLPLAGADSANVFPLRSIKDVDRIRKRCSAGKNVVIIGGGFIGLEVAAVARKLEMNATVIEGMDRVLARVTAPDTSHFYEKVHRDAGVDIRTGAAVTALEGTPEISQVVLDDGSKIPADLVIIGIGIVPNVELAENAGINVDNGIVVNEHTQTSDPDIYAIGDCSNHHNPMFDSRVRLESVQNAMDQGRCAAANILGKATTYNALPWFWSDQYDLKLQMAGLSQGFDTAVTRGNPDERSFSVFYTKEGRLIAADCISRPKDFMVAKMLITKQVHPDLASLADDSVDIKTLLPS